MSLPTYAIPGDPNRSPFLIEIGADRERIFFGPHDILLGLVAHLPADLLPVLLILLANVGPAGERGTFAAEVARILSLHPDAAEARLNQLAAFPSAEEPLVFSHSGAHYLSRQFFPTVVPMLSLTPPDPESYRPVAREEVIAHSRSRYSTPLPEAERAVADQLGIEPLPEGPEGEVLQGLLNAGVARDLAKELVSAYPLERIFAQLHWLPKRAARNPAALPRGGDSGRLRPTRSTPRAANRRGA